MSEGELTFLPLGGVGEIGMNLAVYGYGGKWLIVDCGVSFGDETMPMVDVVMADPTWIEERRDKLVGIVLTHGHEDHLGAVQYLWDRLRCPVWATPFSASILKNKLHETGLHTQVPLNVVELGSRFKAGPFEIEMISITHSIPEPNLLAIRTPLGTVVHTGDWKFDPDPLLGLATDTEALRRVGKEGVLALIGDSTNVFTKGHSGSESEVRGSLIELLGRFDGRIAVSCFATNVARLESIAVAAMANDRSVALVGRSLWRIDKAARENGYLADLPPFLTEHDAAYLPKDKVVYICTGSQGEPRAALARIASGDHPHVKLGKGDVCIFSSRIIPGNEKDIYRLQNDLVRLGVEVVTEKDEFVHVSGHPAREEMEEMYRLLRPRFAVPVHGEARHLQEHARLARSMGVEEAIETCNGTMLRLAPGPVEVVDHVPTGKLCVDGPRIVRIDSEILRNRRRMVFNGSAVVTVVLDKFGKLLNDPQLTALGLLDAAHEAEEHDTVVEAVRDAIEELPLKVRKDDGVVREAARLAVRRSLRDTHGKKPITDVHLVRV
ncbi:Metallo-beta-lactamase family protein RNA-specific [Paramagnetospirillum magnetotacticum MS-1]|uniref:Metallo-beta-lactamase family protein RNA-specific n=1 Tax=Paramagnetospirillum magnetotacticum MS-1 TaxID=272627 RepID=A0A0C2YT81_PARME|nr:ribonuclease J [Paramagnetospirillum magnetotacticum]KIL98363.1 Metallo-beta-lactamase family protein RNA-specific [Paramagnetospirillum magnetotacticum MS-1]